MHYESDHKSPEECLLELMKENLPPEEVIRRFKEKGYSLEGEGKKEDYEEKGKDEHSDYDKEDKKEYFALGVKNILSKSGDMALFILAI